ncbi:MAG: branched-chain amino acid ABC transporter permease [Thermodesulfobacteriota bacterium]
MPEIVSTVLFLLVNGLIWGLIIALIALGLSLIFGVMGIINMAHGDVYMVGAVLSFYVVTHLGNFWLSLVLVPAVIILIAAPMERFVLRPYEGYHSSTMIATVGISFIIQQIALGTYGGIPKKITNPWPISFNFLGVDYPGYRFLVACISILILAGLWLFLYKTSYGILVRASMQDREMASAMGIDVNKVLITTFVIGSVLAAVGGVLAAPINQVFYLMGNDVILLCFIVVIVGGLGSLKGTLIAALSLCSLEGMMASILSPTQARAAIFVIMVIILMRRPKGLFTD